MLLAFSLVHFTWPYISNEFLLNWSGTGNRTHNMGLVFVYRWGERVGKKKRWWQMMFRFITLRFILLLHCFYLCPLCGMAERWAIFWRSTQLNKMISNQQTARGATLKTRTARERARSSQRMCALRQHVENVWHVSFSKFIFLYLQLSCDGRFWHIFNCRGAGMKFFFFSNLLVHKLIVHSWLNDFC